MVTPDVWGSNARCILFMRNNAASGAADIGLLNPRLRAAVYHVINVAMFAEFENVLEIDSEGAVLYNVYKVEKRFFFPWAEMHTMHGICSHHQPA